MNVAVVPYDPNWEREFSTLAQALAHALITVPGSRIEHVGSTSVPGLCAKPVLDVDVIVADRNVMPAILALQAAGYRCEGDRGIPERFSLRAPDGAPRRNVYVCVDGSLGVRNHLAVRDLLRSDRRLRDEYGKVKWELAAAELSGIDEYVARKSCVLREVLAAAGFSEPELAAVYQQNTATPPTSIVDAASTEVDDDSLADSVPPSPPARGRPGL